jgi:hypothetical protein
MSSARTPSARWAAPLLLAALTGCGDGSPKIVKVNGTLTYQGKPVTNAIINFQPEAGRLSWAETDEQGRFKINYDRHQDGAVVGKHKVWMDLRPATNAEREAVMQGKKPPLSKEMTAFFDKYSAEKSTLTVEIKPDTKDLSLNLD